MNRSPPLPRVGFDRRQFLAVSAALGFGSSLRALGARQPTLLPTPDLSDAKILRFVAGLRPYRSTGLRLEVERVGEKIVVHDYGHGGAGVTLAWGCAEEVFALVNASGGGEEPVAVIGAGVIGLTAAFVLASRGRRVRLLAKAFPPETTSNLAGAEWLPFGVSPPAGDDGPARFERIVRESYRAYQSREGDSWGVFRRSHYEVGDAAANRGGVPRDLIAPRRIESLPFPGVARSGHVFDTFLIEPPIFLPRLMAECLEAGVLLERREFASLADLSSLPERIVVNATGLGARDLCNDPAVTPIRGQLVHVFPQDLPYLLVHDGGYFFPRRDAIVLGGTYERGIADPHPVRADCEAVLARHREFFAAT